MKKTVIATGVAPKAIGPYSQGISVECGWLVFCSGQIPVDPATGELVEGTIGEQTRQVLENLKAVLGAAGLTLEHVVKTTVFLEKMDNFAPMNEVYQTYFGKHPPARSTVQVARLPKNAEIEIEAIAAR